MNKLPLSVIILVHRNDENLSKALKSVQFANEIIVVDNNSGVAWDKFTEFPLVIKEHPEPITDFSETRNKAMSSASNDWVFFLDSDEEVSQPAVAQFSELIANPNVHGAVLYRSDVFYGKKLLYGEAGHQPLLRLGRKSRFQFFGRVHEIGQVEGNVAYSQIEILHHAHPSISEFISDVSAYGQSIAATKTSGFGKNLLELLVFPPVKLLYGLFIQGGIMDGWRGVVYASCMSLHSLLVRIYRYEIIENTRKYP